VLVLRDVQAGGTPSYVDHAIVRRDPWGVVVDGDAPMLSRAARDGFDDAPDEVALGNRLYDPQIGRFLQADSYSSAFVRQGRGLDRYRFGWNSPTNYGDPTGTWELPYQLPIMLTMPGQSPSLVPHTQSAVAMGIGIGGMGMLYGAGFNPDPGPVDGTGAPRRRLPRWALPAEGDGDGDKDERKLRYGEPGEDRAIYWEHGDPEPDPLAEEGSGGSGGGDVPSTTEGTNRGPDDMPDDALGDPEYFRLHREAPNRHGVPPVEVITAETEWFTVKTLATLIPIPSRAVNAVKDVTGRVVRLGKGFVSWCKAPKGAATVSQKVANQANHIFGANNLAKHKLGGVLDSFGGDSIAAFRAIETGAQNLANSGAIKGVFETTVKVGEHAVTVRGRVIDDVVNVSTAFIP
jgi:RHS repeat-associated protein